jgi:hypothetical protein
MSDNLPAINSHDSWSPLEEVWLGDVYPMSWYDHLDSEVRDVFYRLTEITQQDLESIESRLEALGIIVRRPVYEHIDAFVDHRDQLIKPQICPRDDFVVIGNDIYGQDSRALPWRHWIEHHTADPRCRFLTSHDACITGANVVRVGRDIMIDRDVFDYEYRGEWPDYRVQVVSNGGHMDGCFAILRPGLILANHYYEDYDRTFPGWEIIRLDDPVYGAAPSRGYAQPYPVYNGKFWDTSVGTTRAFNQHIIDHALDWVGCYTETYFELNCLVIDESNVIMLAENTMLADTLSRRGITIHWVPFRARSFWDGAMHCLTVDIRRRSTIRDYFPDRDG